MDTVFFEGKEYTKAAHLAKRFNYTSDYLGQLCRAEKVDARLVGRAWYINLDSLQNHRKGRYKKEEAKKQELDSAPKKANNNYLSRVDVAPILNKKVVKILKNTDKGFVEVPVRYESDDFSLIPRIEKKAMNKVLHVSPAGAEKVRLSSVKAKETRFKPEPIPEVSLSGSLRISEYETEDVEPDIENSESPPVEALDGNKENVEKYSDNGSKAKILKVKVRKRSAPKNKLSELEKEPEKSFSDLEDEAIKQNSLQKSKATDSSQKPTPKTVRRTELSLRQLATKQKPTSQKSIFPHLVVSFLLAVICSLLIVSTSSEVSVLDARYTSKLSAQLSNLTALFSQ